MNKMLTMLFRNLLALFLTSSICLSAIAQKQYDTGASDSEIRIGNTVPYSGPVSSFSGIGKTLTAYFKMVNDSGGIRGRKINFISFDDTYSPPKAVEMTRKLVESEEVLLMFGQLGTAPNSAVQKYLNTKGVPHLFMFTGASKFFDYKASPWSMAFNPSYDVEGRLIAQEIVRVRPDAKIGVLFQNDDMGKEYLRSFKNQLGARAKQIVLESGYEVTDPTIDSQILALKNAGAETLVMFALGRQVTQTIRKTAELGWKPSIYLTNSSSSISNALTPAGLDKAVGVVTTAFAKDPHDPQWTTDPSMREYLSFISKYAPTLDPQDRTNVVAYTAASLLVDVLRACGDDLTRRNVMKQATSLKDLQMPLLLPGLKINTSPTSYEIITGMRFYRFDGQKYVAIQ